MADHELPLPERFRAMPEPASKAVVAVIGLVVVLLFVGGGIYLIGEYGFSWSTVASVAAWPFVKLWSVPGWIWAALFVLWRIEVVIRAFAKSSDEQTAMLRAILRRLEK